MRSMWAACYSGYMKNAIMMTSIAVIVLTVSGCAIESEDGEGISIRHAAENDLFVQRRADKHCGQFNMTALKVQQTPIDDSIIVPSVVSTFRCVPKS